MAILDLRKSFGADGAANRLVLIAADAAGSNGDEIWLPESGNYPLKVDATTGRIWYFTKSFTMRGKGPLPTSGAFVIEPPAGALATAFMNTLGVERNVGNFKWLNFGIDGQYTISVDAKNAQGLTFLLGAGHELTDAYIRNFVSHMVSNQGGTLVATRLVLSTTDTAFNSGGANHGFDNDEDPATNGPHLTTLVDSIIENRIGQCLKSEKGRVVLLGTRFEGGGIAFGNNDSGDSTPFGNHLLQGNYINSIVTVGDTASSPGVCVGAYATFLANRFGRDGCVIIDGPNTFTARYGNGGANECVHEGNVYEGWNSVIENVTGDTAAGGVLYRNANFAKKNIGVRSKLYRFTRAVPLPANQFTGASNGIYPTPTAGSTSWLLTHNALNATDALVGTPGNYTTANSSQFGVTWTKGNEFIFEMNKDGTEGVVFDGRLLGDAARALTLSPTTGTMKLIGRPLVKDSRSNSTFGAGVDVNPTSPAIVDMDEFAFQNCGRDGAAHYAACLRSRGTGAFGFNRLVERDCLDGNATNAGDGMAFAFEHTGGWIAGKPMRFRLDGFTDRGTDARSGIIAVKTGVATVFGAVLANNITFAGVTAALIYSTVPTGSGGTTVRQLTARNVTGAAAGNNCMKAANGATITVGNYIVDSASRGNVGISASGAVVFTAAGIYQNGGQGEARVTYTGGLLTSDPLLDATGRPGVGSPARNAGVRWWSGYLADASNDMWPTSGADLGALRAAS